MQVCSARVQTIYIGFAIQAFLRLEVYRLHTSVRRYEAKAALVPCCNALIPGKSILHVARNSIIPNRVEIYDTADVECTVDHNRESAVACRQSQPSGGGFPDDQHDL